MCVIGRCRLHTLREIGSGMREKVSVRSFLVTIYCKKKISSQ